MMDGMAFQGAALPGDVRMRQKPPIRTIMPETADNTLRENSLLSIRARDDAQAEVLKAEVA